MRQSRRSKFTSLALIPLLFVPAFVFSITFGFQYFSLAIKKEKGANNMMDSWHLLLTEEFLGGLGDII